MTSQTDSQTLVSSGVRTSPEVQYTFSIRKIVFLYQNLHTYIMYILYEMKF